MLFRTRGVVALVLVLAGVLVLASNARAQTASANFQVTATVINRCSIAAASLEFGDYDPTSTSPLNAQSNLTVSCTRGHTAWIGLNDGTHASGGRRMQNAAATEWLPYSIFRDAGRTTPWGVTQPTGFTYVSAGRAPQQIPMYGQVPVGADVSAGSFTDTVQATINF